MGAIKAFDAGFTAQVSVMPPGANVATGSKLAAKDAGKAPAVKGEDGLYRGYNWMTFQPSRESVAHWVRQGSSIGFLATAYPAIDIDVLNEQISRDVVTEVVENMGGCIIRTGQAPKRLLVFRCAEPLRSFDMHYEKWNDLLGAYDKQLIQFLGKGRQYVMFGNHPRTMKPYQIEDKLNTLGKRGPEALPLLTADRVAILFDAINRVMAGYGYETTNSAAARLMDLEVDQDDLKAPNLTDLANLIERTPNTLPDRDDYISMGYAIKAASQDDTEAGFEIFMNWCERWDQGGNDPATVRQDWDKMTPPYRVGWDHLLQHCRQQGADTSDFWFGPAEPRPDEEPAPGEGPQPQVGQADGEDALLSDRWLARRFLQLHGKDFLVPVGMDSSYCLKWDGTHWQTVTKGLLKDRVATFLAGHVSLARTMFENPKEGATAAMRLGSYKTIQNVSTMVMESPTITPEMDTLDAHPDLIDTPEGPLHLPTGEVLEPDKSLLLTKQVTVQLDPTVYCPRWKKFIKEVTLGDRQLAFYLQCLAGYALTGHTREHVFPFFIGDGGNGKSKYLWVLQRILGPNAVSLPVELLQLGRVNGDPAYQLARIHGARLITTTETKAGGRWDEQRIKQITGEDEIQGRHPFGRPFSFQARCTMVVAGNHMPDLDEVTDAMARRIQVVPWNFKPRQADVHLEEKLAAELPGIFAWCAQGAVAWYQHGLPECGLSREVTREYLSDQDQVHMWALAAVEPTRNYEEDFVSNKELYDHYLAWCQANAVDPYGKTKFFKRITTPLKNMKLRRHRTPEMRGWCGGVMKIRGEVAPPNVLRFPAVAPPPPRG